MLISVLVLAIIASAFFSSAETAMTGVDKLKLGTLVSQGKRKARLLAHLLDDPKYLLTGILIGNNIANVAATSIATSLVFTKTAALNLSPYLLLAINTVGITSVILFFCEITPKSIVLKNPTAYAMMIARALRNALIILKPFIFIFTGFSQLVFRILGVSFDPVAHTISQAEIKTVVDMAEKAGLIEAEESDMIHSIFTFGDTVAREIMTPRTDTVCVTVHDTIADTISLIVEKGHSRIPVYDNEVDNIVGIIYAKDLLQCDTQSDSLHKYKRDALFIPETKDIESLFRDMQKSKCHIAIVVNEHGGMAGIITLEDIIEEIFGEIHDEYDTDNDPLLIKTEPNTYSVNAKISMAVFIETFNLSLEESDDYDTLGGFVLHELGHFPTVGESFTVENLTITVNSTNQQRILTLGIIVSL